MNLNMTGFSHGVTAITRSKDRAFEKVGGLPILPPDNKSEGWDPSRRDAVVSSTIIPIVSTQIIKLIAWRMVTNITGQAYTKYFS